MPLEIACFNVHSALHAAASGAHRIELCADPSVGGITPTHPDYLSLYQNPDVLIPVNVMIRPRGGDFTYTPTELDTMLRDIELFMKTGADGFVFGILTADHTIDEERCRALLVKAEGKPCTFHRAFDEISQEDMKEQLEVLIKLGFKAVLTSGGAKNAVEGKAMLRELVDSAEGRISVIVGGGVRSKNLGELRREVRANWWHSSAVIDGGEIAHEEEILALRRELGVA